MHEGDTPHFMYPATRRVGVFRNSGGSLLLLVPFERIHEVEGAEVFAQQHSQLRGQQAAEQERQCEPHVTVNKKYNYEERFM